MENVPSIEPRDGDIFTQQWEYILARRVFRQYLGDSPNNKWITVPKFADESITSDSTLTADSELKFPMEALKTYSIRGTITYLSTPNPDFKFDFNGTASPTTLLITGSDGNDSRIQLTMYTSALSTLQADSLQRDVHFNATIENGVNAGDFQFRWAQNTSHADTTKVLKGSYIEYMEIPSADLSLLLETGDVLLLETGDEILL